MTKHLEELAKRIGSWPVPSDFTLIRQIITQAAFESGAIRLDEKSPFTWASGYRMPIYNDNRQLLQSPLIRKVIKAGLILTIGEDAMAAADVIAGVATAGIPHATTLADHCELPLAYVRSSAKDHGMGRQIEGASVKGKRVILVEDLISTGGSSVAAAVAVREAGATNVTCVSVFSYGFPKAEQAFKEQAIEAYSILDLPILVDIAEKATLAAPETIASIRQWMADPFTWGEKNGFPKKEKSA